jgi:hypothetical protein
VSHLVGSQWGKMQGIPNTVENVLHRPFAERLAWVSLRIGEENGAVPVSTVAPDESSAIFFNIFFESDKGWVRENDGSWHVVLRGLSSNGDGMGSPIDIIKAQLYNLLTQFGEEPRHWRSRVSSLAYCTHAITPVMYVTDTLPTEVSAFVIPSDSSPESLDAARRGRGIAAVMLIRMDTGAYLKSLHGFLQGEQEPETSWIRIHGSRGLLENLRHGDSRRVRVRKEAWTTPSGQVEDTVHDPVGGRGDDALVCESFARAMQTGEPPYFDVYRGVIASLVGICGLRSLLHGSVPVAIPDLRQEDVRHEYESDDWNGLEAPPQ